MVNPSNPFTRRRFLKQMAAAGAASVFVPLVGRAQVPGRALRVAFIGTAGIGSHHLNEFSGLAEQQRDPSLAIDCPCFCDVDKSKWGEAAQKFPNAKGYQDYREMIEKEEKNFDAAVVGTPDHHHYPATLLCMMAGKSVYTQKPLTHTVWESRQLAEAARKYKVATQMGNQGHGKEGWRLVYEWIHGDALGTIKEVHSWTNRPIWPQGIDRPEGSDPVPESLNWDAWIGPAPMRPYKQDVYHPFKWRGWWDFGAGALGDMAAHTMDGMFWALDSFDPVAIEPVAMTPMGGNGETFPNSSMIKWEFPAKGDRPAFVGYWYDGGLKPPRPPELEPNRQMPTTGNLFIGTKATILIQGDYGDSPRIIPEAKMREIGRPKKLLERSPGNYAEWVAAAKGDKPLDYCMSNFSYAGPMSEVMLLGNVALRAGQRIEWDQKSLKVTNLPEANKYINKEYRDGWKFTL